jgi:hypothetical protein
MLIDNAVAHAEPSGREHQDVDPTPRFWFSLSVLWPGRCRCRGPRSREPELRGQLVSFRTFLSVAISGLLPSLLGMLAMRVLPLAASTWLKVPMAVTLRQLGTVAAVSLGRK